MRVGMTLNMETPVDAIFPYLDELDDVMLMSIKPGWSGQVLDPEVYPRLESVRAEVDRRGLATAVELDGGVKVDNAQRAIDAGSDGPGGRIGDLPVARSRSGRPRARGYRAGEAA